MKLGLVLILLAVVVSACEPRRCVRVHEETIRYAAYTDDDGRLHDGYEAHRFVCDEYAKPDK